jgi:hypothetical protein
VSEIALNSVESTFPLSAISGKSRTNFQKEATVVFKADGAFYVQNEQFRFVNGTILPQANLPRPLSDSGIMQNMASGLPLVSIFSVVLIIMFRNLFFAPFQKYFVSPVNNYEIDFNFQKIGVFPLIFAVFIILFSISGFVSNPDISAGLDLNQYVREFKLPLEIFGYPMLISALSLFFLSLSGKIFPLIFSDMKIFFGLSFLLLLWNFAAFGSDIEAFVPFRTFLNWVISIYFILRTFLFFQVLRRSYRFQMPLTLFYICTLNLSTFLILLKVLQFEFN